jgi:pimeloyl-ACP methyl ester carboxylesterase
VLKGMSEPDRIIASRPEVRSVLLEAFLEAVRSGTRGVECEMEMRAKPWGFQPEEITIEVNLWHGELDTSVPLSEAELLAGAIPDSHLTVCKGAGHILIDTCFEEILSAVTR